MLYRAFHTAGVELAERGDDSYGNIGELRVDAFRTHLGIDWAAAGMAPEHRWQDLCELLVSEVYALTDQRETLAFRHVPAAQADLLERIFLGLAGEWRAAHQDYQADEALQLVAVAPQRRPPLLPLRRRRSPPRLGPLDADRRPRRSATAGGRKGLAVEVFRAADQPGLHRDHLRDRCLKLTGIRLDDPHRRCGL